MTRLEQLARRRRELERELADVIEAIDAELARPECAAAPRRRHVRPRPVASQRIDNLAMAEADRILRGKRR